jgi:glutamate synthase (NADPH/NADH) small chain
VPADLVLLAMGFVSPVASVLDAFGVDKDARGNARAGTEGVRLRDQRAEGVRGRRHAPRPVAGGVGDPRGPPGARAVDEYLMGSSDLPR